MTRPPDSGRVPSAWMEKAGGDLAAGKQLLSFPDACQCEIVCYHAQQCVEKSLKALLVHLGVDFPKTHGFVANSIG
jgi:HEPN domain-containing protein